MNQKIKIAVKNKKQNNYFNIDPLQKTSTYNKGEFYGRSTLAIGI